MGCEGTPARVTGTGMQIAQHTQVFVGEGVERGLDARGRTPEQLRTLPLLCREDAYGAWLYLDGEDDTYGRWRRLAFD